MTWNDATMATLCIGTAQWGSDYGLTNTGGRLSDEEVQAIMETAIKTGIRAIDTADSYGDAQLRMRPWAREFSITSKISGAAPLLIPLLIEKCLAELGVAAVQAVLIHDWDALDHGAQVSAARALGVAHEAGFIKRCGVSTYEEVGIATALQAFESVSVDLGTIQVPANALDRRLEDSPAVTAAVRRGTQIQVRSVFLQGLLATRMPHGIGLHPDVVRYHDWVSERAESPIGVALSHASSLPWVNEIVVGVTTKGELVQVLEALRITAPTLLPTALASRDPQLIDPRNW